MDTLLFFAPMALGVFGNICYNVFARSIPDEADTFASLTITYITGMILAFALFFITTGGGDILAEFAKANWASYGLGVCIVGCDVAIILLYRAGWDISVGTLVGNISVSLALVVVGVLFWAEALSVVKMIGIAICLVGLYVVNMPDKQSEQDKIDEGVSDYDEAMEHSHPL